MSKYFVVRLNDGETYTDLEECALLIFDEEPTDEMVKYPGMENRLASFHVVDERAEITTWKKSDRIRIVKEWDG